MSALLLSNQLLRHFKLRETVNGFVLQLVNDMEVFFRHLDAGVSHKCLNRLYIGSAVKHVHRETVPRTMPCDMLGDAGLCYPFPDMVVAGPRTRKGEYRLRQGFPGRWWTDEFKRLFKNDC